MPVLSSSATLNSDYNNTTTFSYTEIQSVAKEIGKLLDKGVIELPSHEKDEFLSPVFLLPKDDGSFRMILNIR